MGRNGLNRQPVGKAFPSRVFSVYRTQPYFSNNSRRSSPVLRGELVIAGWQQVMAFLEWGRLGHPGMDALSTTMVVLQCKTFRGLRWGCQVEKFLRGRRTWKVLPLPTSLSTSRRPPWPCTIRDVIVRPSPSPFPAGFTVKKGSKIRVRCSDRTSWTRLARRCRRGQCGFCSAAEVV